MLSCIQLLAFRIEHKIPNLQKSEGSEARITLRAFVYSSRGILKGGTLAML